jgi:hypothetical protein
MELGTVAGWSAGASSLDLEAIAAMGAGPAWQIHDRISGVRTLFVGVLLAPANIARKLAVVGSARRLISRRNSCSQEMATPLISRWECASVDHAPPVTRQQDVIVQAMVSGEHNAKGWRAKSGERRVPSGVDGSWRLVEVKAGQLDRSFGEIVGASQTGICDFRQLALHMRNEAFLLCLRPSQPHPHRGMAAVVIAAAQTLDPPPGLSPSLSTTVSYRWA